VYSVLAFASALSPISRVVELLKGLAEKVEDDMKNAENLYEDFVCWGKTIVSTKTETNEKAKSRIDSLESYVADLDAGRIELTTERVDLEKELATLNAEIETATALREKEKKDFEAASDEMESAIKALDDAIDVLKEATKDHEEGSLLALRGTLNGGFHARVEEASALAHAVDVGRRFLSEGDSLFLQRVLTGDVPDKDWKKLNRKATFKMSYKARSFKIQGVLAKLLASFKKSLKEAEEKEEEAVDTHKKLMKSKGDLKGKAEDALSSMNVEGGARGLSKSQAQDEISDLKDQVKNDEKFITETESALEKKKGEWKVRKELMVGEVAAINKAISILHSDDARDMFKKSFKSQGYSFLQLRNVGTGKASLGSAVGILRTTASEAGDKRLLALAVRASMTAQGHFDKVISAIDDMIAKLKKEEETDLKNKEDCESDRMDDLREAAVTSREIDEATDEIDRLKTEIDEANDEIKEKETEIKTIKKELADAKKVRERETASWKKEDADDKAAAELVESAAEVLENFYKENNLNLMQQKHTEPPVVTAGEAPPPPPATWEEPYGGATGESGGIVAILEMIENDITKDRKKAKQEEDDAQAEFDDFEKDSNTQIKDLEDAVTTLEKEVSDKEDTMASEQESRGDKKNSLDSTMSKIKDALPGCDFVAVNFELRNKNRQIEIDGLDKAKAILKGAEFD